MFHCMTPDSEETISVSGPWDLAALRIEAVQLRHELRTEAARVRAAGRWTLAGQLTSRTDRIDQRLAALEAELHRLHERGDLLSCFQRKA
jgi:hypothetical protein